MNEKLKDDFEAKQRELKVENDKIYRKPVKKDYFSKDEKHGNLTKTKVLEKITYSNGVAKTRLVGVLKDGRVQWGDQEKINKGLKK
ncbi:MAG: hypothetical protein GY853_02045 [PVC group bacterium]|nr:hypothetical protein [PVC group bacterium]